MDNTAIKEMYTIRDLQANLNLDYSIWLFPNEKVAIRKITDLISDASNYEWNKYPEHFCLVRLGTYNLQTGVIESDVEHLLPLSAYVISKSEIEK